MKINGQKIKIQRIISDVSQEEIAETLALPTSYINYMESHEVIITLDQFKSLSSIFNLKPETFLKILNITIH